MIFMPFPSCRDSRFFSAHYLTGRMASHGCFYIVCQVVYPICCIDRFAHFQRKISRRRQCTPAVAPGAHCIGILFAVSFQIGQLSMEDGGFMCRETLLAAEAGRQEARADNGVFACLCGQAGFAGGCVRKQMVILSV